VANHPLRRPFASASEVARRASLAPIEPLAIVSIVALLSYLVTVALRLRIDYFDAYQNLLDSGAIVGDSGFYPASDYSTSRGIFYPLLLTPLALIGRLSQASGVEFVAVHLVAVLLFGLFLLASYRLFRLFLNRLTALAGVVLLSWNLLLLSNAPMGKEDIPGALFLTAGFYFYLRGRRHRQPSDFFAAGLLLGAAIGTRYFLLPIPFLVIGAYELLELVAHLWARTWVHGDGGLLLIKGVALFALPTVVFLLLPVAVYPAIHRASAMESPAQFIRDIFQLMSVAGGVHSGPPVVNYRFILESVTAPALFVGAFGVVASLWRRQSGSLFCALWLGTFLILQTYLVAHKEARYLIPALPPLYYFIAAGLEELWTLVREAVPRPRLGHLVGTLLLVAVLLLPAARAMTAAARYLDPVYTQDYEAVVSRYATSLAGSARILWVGPLYTIHPVDYVFDLDDPFTYIYHYYTYGATFWGRKPVFILDGVQIGSSPAGESAASVGPNLGSRVQEGDVLIVNPAPAAYSTADVPADQFPLVVEQVHIVPFTASAAPGPRIDRFTSTGGGQITAQWQGSAATLDGVQMNVPEGRHELYAAGSDRLVHSVGLVDVIKGRFHAIVTLGSQPIEQISLLYYSGARTFPAP
jgi:hypothetical protein